MSDSIVVKQALCDLTDATKLFYLIQKAITSVNITSAPFFISYIVIPNIKLTPSSENPLIFMHLISKSLPTSATGPEERRPHCLEEAFDPSFLSQPHLLNYL
ncbi:MAG: hypothetical protein EZS28_009433 [Streblomastix strix]|uniref:Uncharacterized protein n=1 Tax=Streblomastix strix TaxID=222440 RepID=A0A5J4WJD8_9EUKA|nr:MAG: hypothetical protein EZS28_009433 [Streblomastix strix]